MKTIEEFRKALNDMEIRRSRQNAEMRKLVKTVQDLREGLLYVDVELKKIDRKYPGWAWIKNLLTLTKSYERVDPKQ